MSSINVNAGEDPQEDIPVDADGYAICPDCQKAIKCGPGGSKNLNLRHRGTAKCKAAAAKLSTKAKLKDSSLKGFFMKRGPALARVPTTTTLPVILPKDTPLCETTTTDNVLSQPPPSVTPEPSCAPTVKWFKSNLANALQTLVDGLPPPSTDIALADNILSAFHTDPSNYNNPLVSDEDLWEEVLNPLLKDILGWGTELDVEAIVRGNRDGLNGLAPFVEFFVVCRRVDEALFEGKLGHLMSALRDRQLTTRSVIDIDMPLESAISLNTSPRPQPVNFVPRTPAANSISNTLAACKGYPLPIPPGNSPHSTYPFSLHDTLSLPWNYEVKHNQMVLRSFHCKKSGSLVHFGICSACHELSTDATLKGIIDRMEHGINDNTPYAYYSINGLKAKLRQKDTKISFLKLRGISQARTILRKTTSLGYHKRLMVAVASRRYGNVERLFQIALRQKRGVPYIISMYEAAASNLYRPKSFSEHDDMLGLLLMKLGGSRIAGIAHRALGLPGITTLRNRAIMPPLIPSPSHPTESEVSKNLLACFESLKDVLAGVDVLHANLQLDEIAVERRIRWDDHTNVFLGVCREHGKQTALEFNSESDMVELFQSLDNEEVHFAREATVGAIGIMDQDTRVYAARPIVISGDCKQETGEDHADLIRTLINSVSSNKLSTKVRVVSIASDGETRRGSALSLLTYQKPLSTSSPIYSQLFNLTFLDLYVGSDDITADKDWKHVIKRFRNLLLRPRGVLVHGFRITPAIIGVHLKMADLPAIHVNSICNPDDEQDVKLAFDLLRAIWNLSPLSNHKNPAVVEARSSLVILGRLFYHTVFPYLCTDLTLSEQLEHLSAAAHLALALFHESGSQFIPTLLYTDLQIMIKNIFFCVAKAKVDRPECPFFIVLQGTDRLEELFGILRTMVGNDANLDIWQLGSRLTGTTQVSNILAKYPHWDRAPRRLKLPALTREMHELPDASDHIKPASWKGNVVVNQVTLLTAWKRGRRLAEKDCPFSGSIFSQLEASPNINILSPRGTALIGSNVEGNAQDDESFNSFQRPSALRQQSSVSTDDLGPSSLTENQAIIEDEFLESELPHIDDGSSSYMSYSILDGKKFARRVIYQGKLVSKSRAISLHSKLRGRAAPASTDRLRRVQGTERFSKAIESNGGCTHLLDDSELLTIQDPVATLVKCDGHIFLCIGEVNNIKIVSEPPVEAISMDDISESDPGRISISISVLGLRRSIETDDPSLICDWRTYRPAQERTIHVTAKAILPLNPTISSSGLEHMFYLLEGTFLVALVDQLYSSADTELIKRLAMVPISPDFPYYEETGKACFSVSAISLDGAGGVMNACPICDPPFELAGKVGPRILEHMASHILHDLNINREDEPCGLCLRPSPQCLFFLKKGANGNIRINKEASTGCPNAIQYQYGPAERSTSDAVTLSEIYDSDTELERQPAQNLPNDTNQSTIESTDLGYNTAYSMLEFKDSKDPKDDLTDNSSATVTHDAESIINESSETNKSDAVIVSDVNTILSHVPNNELALLDASNELESHIATLDSAASLPDSTVSSLRPHRKRTHFDVTDLSYCDCGASAKPKDDADALNVAQCKSRNCQTIWVSLLTLTFIDSDIQ
uniref:Uncharacterized protein n=1 Tax=Psilocybe cubensis TaxID=181762 RepID=A0A8H7XX72_PSICU